MAVIVSTDVRDDSVSGFNDALNTALGSAGVIEFFDGSLPVDCAAADSGTLLASCALSNPAFGAPSANVFQTDTITPSTVIASSNCNYWRMKNSSDVCKVQGSVSETFGMGAIVFNTLAWTSGDDIEVDVMIWTTVVEGTP